MSHIDEESNSCMPTFEYMTHPLGKSEKAFSVTQIYRLLVHCWPGLMPGRAVYLALGHREHVRDSSSTL